MDCVEEVPLPFPLNRLIEEICAQKLLPMPDVAARKTLSKITEESAIDVLKRVRSTTTPIYNLSGYIVFMVNKYGLVASTSSSSHGDAESIRLSSRYPSSPSSSVSSTPRSTPLTHSLRISYFRIINLFTVSPNGVRIQK